MLTATTCSYRATRNKAPRKTLPCATARGPPTFTECTSAVHPAHCVEQAFCYGSPLRTVSPLITTLRAHCVHQAHKDSLSVTTYLYRPHEARTTALHTTHL